MSTINTEQETAWVERAAGGDREAFAQLTQRYWRPLRSWLFGLSGEYHTAEDLAQDAFLRAWRGLPKLSRLSGFRVWLFRIARNQLLASRRKAILPREAEFSSETHARDGDPVATLEHAEGAAALQLAIGRLSADFREPYLLWTTSDWSYAEIAGVMDCSEETARWRVCEARKRLVKELESYLGFGE